MAEMLPDWAVAKIVERAGRGISESDVEQIVRSVIDSASYAFEAIKNRGMEAMAEHDRPCVLLRPALSRDGNLWCALYGENLQDGVAGYGASPADAFWDFDRNFATKLPAPSPSPEGGEGGER